MIEKETVVLVGHGNFPDLDVRIDRVFRSEHSAKTYLYEQEAKGKRVLITVIQHDAKTKFKTGDHFTVAQYLELNKRGL